MILSALSLTFLLTRINAELTSQETNALSIGATSMLGLTRPDQFSTGMAYTSWESLTDRSYYDRQIKAAPQDWVDSLPSLDDVSELFVNPQDGVRKYSLYSTMLLPIFADYLTEGFIYPDNYQNSDMPFNYGKVGPFRLMSTSDAAPQYSRACGEDCVSGILSLTLAYPTRVFFFS